MLYYQKINCVFNKIKKGKLNIKKDSVGKYRHLNPYFDQSFYSTPAKFIHSIGYDSIRRMKWMVHYYDTYYENIFYFDLMASALYIL